ncbi:MAG TPA: hypothetical protein VJ953_22420 [Saprospiraceae bacterium]|nr:hypothetical protein [Saprospiraceae bacterium]
MIEVLFAQDIHSIPFDFSAGLSLALIGSLALFIIYKIDRAIQKSTVDLNPTLLLVHISESTVRPSSTSTRSAPTSPTSKIATVSPSILQMPNRLPPENGY